jgi:hypothetical protein
MIRKAIEQAFKSKGVDSMSKKDLIYTLSFDLNLFSFEEAKKVVEQAEQKGIVKEQNGELKLNENVFDRIVRAIAEKTDKDVKDVLALINEKHNKLKTLAIEVVALIVAKEHGIDITEFIEDVEKVVLN